MPLKVTQELLNTIGRKGTYLAVELNETHHQDDCSDVPANTKGIITSTRGKDWVFVFPHSILKERKVFSDGDVRIVPSSKLKILGRVG